MADTKVRTFMEYLSDTYTSMKIRHFHRKYGLTFRLAFKERQMCAGHLTLYLINHFTYISTKYFYIFDYFKTFIIEYKLKNLKQIHIINYNILNKLQKYLRSILIVIAYINLYVSAIHIFSEI